MIFLQNILIGLLFGYGAAIPIGPINVEMVRRNLKFGTAAGLFFGFGAGLSDMTYLALLTAGAIAILTHATAMRIISLIGAIILVWFAVMAFRTNASKTENTLEVIAQRPLWRHTLDSYLLTLLNPYTILFWSSVGAQVASYSGKHDGHAHALAIGLGVLLAVVSWAVILNVILHYTKHRLPEKANHYLNYIGGTILLIFAALSVWHAIW